MEPVAVITATAPLLGGLLSAAGAWLRGRSRRLSRRDLGALPPGSRVIDLGGRGLVVEIGGPARPSSPAGDE
ncbi:hypothetical protein [Actinoallomurus iriomotensis]|uniref:Uncharacterized protein n=1 Tax=Actinoallomurus iriomotensis TaxID=478107 RepID=A0A9W6S5U4_9ACTN|nr:hypothetical protein [Actinoallomurus iriomotensis]GLY87629.1 hypothetical protein Airi02_055580 [Actinoallomurus iriomotensis]